MCLCPSGEMGGGGSGDWDWKGTVLFCILYFFQCFHNQKLPLCYVVTVFVFIKAKKKKPHTKKPGSAIPGTQPN